MNYLTVNFKNLLKRPELVTLVVAVVFSLLAGSRLVERAGMELPTDAIATIVVAVWSLFVTTVLEGWKRPDYQAGLDVLKGYKTRMAIVVVVGQLIVTLLRTVNINLPQDTIDQVALLFVASMFGKALSDRSAENVRVAALKK